MAYTDTYRYAYPNQDIDPLTGMPLDPSYPPYLAPPQAPVPVRPRGAVEGITQEQDPRKAALQDRTFAYNRGSELDTSYLDDQNRAAFERNAFQNKLSGVYDPMIEGRGGLTPDQLSSITREGDLTGLNMSPDEIANSYLSPEERQAIQGNTNNRRKYFNPEMEGQIYDEGASRERGAVDQYGQGLQNSFDPNTLRPTSGFYNALGSGVDEFGRSVNQALDPNSLKVSDEFLKNYQLTPQQQQDIVTSAGATVGNRDKAAIGELERRARAAGTNPLGVAAQRMRMERESSANAADAGTAARVAASAEAAKRLQTGEAMRIGAGQTYAGLKTDAAGRVLDAGYRAATAAENARGAGERDIADRRMTVADRSGTAQIGSESDLAKRRLALQQNITQVGNEAERDVETADTERARYLAANRQGNDQYVQGQRYTRGTGAYDRLTDRYRYATDANRADAAEGRGYYNAQGNQANANYQAAAGQRAGIYGTQAGAGQAATRTQVGIDEAEKNRPKWYDKLIGAASGAAKAYFGGGYAQGGVVTEPTYALIGENGPEMVVPFNGQNPQVPPSAAMLQPGQPQPFATAPPPPRGRSPYSQQYRYAS